jgi:hypothetical protein
VHEFSEEQRVSDSLGEACLKWERAADAWEHVTWIVAKNPKEGTPINESGNLRLLLWAGARSIDMPDVELIYSLNDETIRLLDVKFTEAAYGQAGRA